jgi:hypothetical protein
MTGGFFLLPLPFFSPNLRSGYLSLQEIGTRQTMAKQPRLSLSGAADFTENASVHHPNRKGRQSHSVRNWPRMRTAIR